MGLRQAERTCLALVVCLAAAQPCLAQAPTRKLGQIRLNVVGVSATLDPLSPVVPKNTASAVRIVVRSGEEILSAADLATFLGTAGYKVEALLSGPGLPFTISLPQLDVNEPLPADPLLLPLPPLRVGGDYSLSNIRVTVAGESVLDVEPSAVTLKVIDQILITSVKTRPLTLDEIKEKGIVLDSDDYLGFEFTMALSLDSKAVNFSFPVVFNRQGVAIPQPILDPLKTPSRELDIPGLGGGGMGAIYATLLDIESPSESGAPLTTPKGEPIRIPSLLVIPGHVGYLKQFFSAQLFVSNGAPGGSNLVVKDVTGTLSLPLGKDGIPSSDDPLALPEITRNGETILQPLTMDVLGLGPDGQPGTEDDVSSLNPNEQGQVEFLLRGEKEGFHTIDFAIAATLEGLPVGPVKVKGKASGGVLVRNPYFDMTFTVPSVVRRQEQFKVFVNVTNIGQGAANLVDLELDSAAMSGLDFGTYPNGEVETGSRHIDTIGPGDTKTMEFLFKSQKTGQVVATYLKFDPTQGGAASGKLNFTIGVGDRGVPLSPDTLVLPTAVDLLPQPLIEAAMRVLGQGWSLAGAAPGTLPAGVIKTSKAVVTLKALAFAEAGLRVKLGQDVKAAIRDLIFDFYSGDPIDPGFDQLLRKTEAGRDFARALGAELAEPMAAAHGIVPYERELARLAASGPDFLSFAVTGATPVDVVFTDTLNHRLVSGRGPLGVPEAAIPGGVIIPVGPPATAPLLGIVTGPVTSPYTLAVSGAADVVVTYPRGDGTYARAPLTTEGPVQIVVDLASPDTLTLRRDLDGDGTFEAETTVTPSDSISPEGPQLLTANIIGPETLQGGNPLGLYAALLFDRVVDADSAASKDNYAVPSNAVQVAKRQLSGRLVFAALEQPEGPYVPTTVTVSDMADSRGVSGPPRTVALGSLLDVDGAVVIGRVVSADGTPVAAGVVYYSNHISDLCEGSGVGHRVAQVPLTSDGRYELRYVRRDPCGRPFGVATTDPVSNFERSITAYVRRGGERMVLDLALLGKGSVAGTVRDLTGAVVPGALVVAISAVDENTGGNTTTDGQGRYVVNGVTVGPVTVKAGKGTGIGRSSGRIERAGTTATVDVNIDYGGAVRISGTVRRAFNGVTEVVPGALVIDSMEGGPAGYAWTDAEGKYVLENMPVGPFTVSTNQGGAASGNGFKGANLKVDILIEAGGGPGGLRFGVVKGVVRLPNGSPAPGVIVAQDITGFVIFDGTVSGPDGRFSLGGIRVGDPVQVGAITKDRVRKGYTYATIDPVTLEANDVVITLSGIGTLEFQVLGSGGLPITGQDVSLFDSTMTLGGCKNPCGCTTAKTGTDGRARFFNRPLGGMTAQAIQFGDGFVDVAQGTAQIRRDGEIGYGVIQFRGTGTVTGKVFAPEGVVATGGEVRMSSYQFENDGQFTCGLVMKDSHRGPVDPVTNEFRFNKVLVGPVYLNVTHPLFPSVAASGTLTAPGQVLPFTIQLVDTISGVLTGTIFLPDGSTPAGAAVEVTANGPVPDVMVKTDAQGHFRFAKVFPQGTYSITARDPRTGLLSQETIYLRAREDAVHDQRLKGRGTVRVRVLDGSDQPVASAFVSLRETDFPGRAYEGAVDTANQGVAVLEGVFEGRFSVTASDSYGRGGRASGTITRPGETAEVTVRMTSVGTVRGRFVMPDHLTPVPFGVVRLVAGGRVIGQTTTPGSGDNIGGFLFDYVPVGDLRVEGQDPLTLRTGTTSGRLDRDGQEITLEVVAQGLGAVQGLVRSRRNGGALEPEAGAHVEVESAGYKSATTTDSGGRYVLEGIPEGQVTAVASLNGFLRGTAVGLLTGDGTVLDLDVTLQDSAKVTGTVIKAGTTSEPGPISTVAFQNGAFRQTRSSDEAGRFQFDRVPVGSATLLADVPNSLDEGRASADVPPGEIDVPIVLNGVGSITGVARDFLGSPVPGYVRVVGSGPVPYFAERPVGTNGTFFLPEVPAGPFVATVTGLGDFPLKGSNAFTVLPDEARQVEVRLQQSGTVTGFVVYPDGNPAVGADVTVLLTPNRGSALVQTLANGRFTLTGVPLGEVQVQVRDNVTAGVARKGPLSLSQDLLDFGTIPLDTTPVAVTSVDPPNGATGIQPSQIVRITFSDPLQSSAGIQVRSGTQVLGASATLSLDGLTVSLRGPWPDTKDIDVVATAAVRDVYGRGPTQEFTSRFRTADLSPPQVTAVSPAFGAIQVDIHAPIVVTFSEPLAPTTNLALLVALSGPGSGTVSGNSAFTTPSVVTFTPTGALAGNASYTMTVSGALDESGNRQASTFTSSFKTSDSEPPVITLHEPLDGAWVRSRTPRFFLSLSDTLSGVDMSTAVLAIDGVTAAATRGSNTLTFVPTTELAEGPHRLCASVRDNANNLTILPPCPTGWSRFSVDSVPPTPPVVTGYTEGQVLSGPLTISASASDASSGLARIEILSDGVVFLTLTLPTPLTPMPVQATYGTAGLPEGSHTFTARAVDVAGNIGPSTAPPVHVTVDNQALTLAITAPAAGTAVRDSVTVRASTSEPVAAVEFSVGTVVVADNSAPYEATLNLAAVPEGSALVKAKAVPVPGSGDPAFAQLTIVVDRTPPSAPDGSKITAVSDGAYAQVQGAAEAMEAGLRIEATNVATSAAGSAYSGGNGAFGFSIQALAGHTLSLTVLDAAGNRSAPTIVPVTARPTGTVHGRVFQPDGTTPAGAGVAVTLWGVGTMPTLGDGTFAFAGVPLGSGYVLEARVNNRLRAQLGGIPVTQNGQMVERNLTLVGVGTVTGLVKDAANLPLASAHVSLASQTPIYGGSFPGSTDQTGRYTITDVPVGDFTVSIVRGPDRADGGGNIPTHGAEVTVNLRLISAAVNLPIGLVDGNLLTWTIGSSGSVGAPWGMLDATSPRLTVLQGGSAFAFAGSSSVASSEEGYREIVVGQSGLAGLDVTRKVYVPSEGYFVRHLDTLSNPGTSPVTVDLQLELGLGPSWPQATRVVASSSSGTALDAQDRWAVFDDNVDDADVFDGNWHFAPLPVVFHGPGGTAPSDLVFDTGSRRITSRWNAVTVAPGQSVSFLYAYTAQADRARGSATAARLDGLPPEMLQGLSAAEASAVRNFAVPGSLVSALPPLPPNDGVVSGQLFAWDGVTPSAGAPQTFGVFKSQSSYFGRPYAISVDGSSGAYLLRSDLSRTDFFKRLVPREPFDVRFTSSQILNPTASATGTFAITPGGSSDLTTTAGRALQVSSSYPAPQYAPAAAVDGDLGTAWFTANGDAANRGAVPFFEVTLASDATIRQVRVRGVRGYGDNYTIRRALIEVRDGGGGVVWSKEVELPAPLRDADVAVPAISGRSVRLTSILDVSDTPGLAEIEVLGDGLSGASGRARTDASFTGTAILSGRVQRADGTSVGPGSLTISGGGQSRSYTTDGGGNFRLLHLPPATYTLTATHPQSQAVATIVRAVGANQTLTQDLVFPAFGAIAGVLRTATTLPLANSYVELEGKGRYTYSNASGAYSFADVTPGSYRVRAYDSTRSNVSRFQDVMVTADATANADFAFPPVGSLQVTVSAGGTAVSGVSLRWHSDNRGPGYVCCPSTDSLGKVTFNNVVGSDVTVQAGNPGFDTYVRGEGTVVVAEGQASALTLTVPGAGTVTGILRTRDGAPQSGHSIYALHATDPVTYSNGSSDGAGRFTVNYVVEGSFRLQGRRPSFYYLLGFVDTRAEVRGALAGQGTTVALDALLPMGRLGVSGQRDFWEIEAAAGQLVDVLLVGTALGTTPALSDPHLALYGPDGTLAGESDNISTSDHNARVRFTAGAAGRYLIVARAAGTETGGYELISPTHVLRAYAGATVSGTLRRDVGSLPAAGHAVRITPSALVVVTGTDGTYTAPLLAAGPFTVEALDAEGVVVASTSGSIAEGESASGVDLTVPVHESVSVTVRRGPELLAGQTVTLESNHAQALIGDRIRPRVTGADGVARTILPLGHVEARVVFGGQTYADDDDLVQGTPLALHIEIPPGLTNVHGVVRATADQTPLPGVTVDLSGVGQTSSDSSGIYHFDSVPAGTYTLSAQTGTVSASVGPFTLSGGDVAIDIPLPVGFVTGRVSNLSNANVVGASVTVVAANGTFNAFTGGDGRYRVAGLAPGAVAVNVIDCTAVGVNVIDCPNPARGGATGTLAAGGQTLTLNVTVATVGTVTGTVFRAGGTVRAAGVQVELYHSSWGATHPPVTTDAQGRYTFEFVRLGSFRVDATDPVNGDRGRTSDQLNVPGDTRTVNFTMTGVGRVVVTVRDASNASVANAEVTVQTHTGLAPTRPGSTGGDGTVTFENVLAGGVTVTARDPVTNLSGSASGTVPVGGTLPIAVTLQPSGSFAGRVLAVGGASGVEGATVRLLYGWGGVAREMPSESDGSYRFQAMPLDTYALEVFFQGHKRVRVTGLVLNANAQTITRDLELVGLGTVRGVVRNPDSSVAPNLNVSLRSHHPTLGDFFSDVTDGDGVYEIPFVPVGDLTVSATSGSNRAEVNGTLASDGEVLTLNLQLQSNTIILPQTLYDANNSPYEVQPSASLRNGTNVVFEGDFGANSGAFLLDVVAGGTANRFAGTSVANTEQSGRELVVTQPNLAGLTVTRKVFVNPTGYMARYLEILQNPGTSAVTVDLKVTSNFVFWSYQGGAARIIRTSSGDNALSVTDPATADRWVVIDDSTDGDPVLVSTLPSTAFVFDGAGAAARVSTATFAAPFAGQLVYQWGGVTVPPGGTVAFLHFGTQQTGTAAARASAERLVQLPPEALDGLSAEEIAAIRNFAVPADGTSPCPPTSCPSLPALSGTVTGTLLGGDGATPVPCTSCVLIKSKNLLFGRTYTASTAADGAFSFVGTAGAPSYNSMVVPEDDFGLTGRISSYSVLLSPEAAGSFPPGETAAVQNVVFSNAGLVRGTLRKHDGSPIGCPSLYYDCGYVQTFGGSPYLSLSTNTAPDGSYVFPVMSPGSTPGSVTVRGIWYYPQGSALEIDLPVTVTPGQTTIADLTFPPMGSVTGVVRTGTGALASGVRVIVSRSGFSRETYTNASGLFTLSDVLTGDFTLTAYEPSSGVPSSAPVTVVEDQPTTQDLVLIGLGAVEVQVNYFGGGAAAGSYVCFQDARNYSQCVGYTDGGGKITLSNVTAGAFSVTAQHPQVWHITGRQTGTLPGAGQTVPVTLTLPATAPVRVTVLRGATPVGGVGVNIRTSLYPYFFGGGATDSDGHLTIPDIPQGAFTVQAYVDGFYLEAPGTVVNDGQQVDVTLATPENPVSLPIYPYLHDANGYYADVAPDGTFVGTTYAFAGDFGSHRGAASLELIQSSEPSRFTGAALGSKEEDGREIAIQQSGVAGLNVTRKIYVPRFGYFARYLDILKNTGDSPVTVQVRVSSHLPTNWGMPSVIATSSGDDVLDVSGPSPDRWVTLDDPQDGDPYEIYSPPAVALVFDGDGAPEHAAEATFEPSPSFGLVAYQWNDVTVPPNGTVAYLHFAVQQASRSAAAMAAERLRNLPPEALAGLSDEERMAVRNFLVPAQSALAPLVPLEGTVTGRVLAGDGTTPVANASVTFQSLHPLFGRKHPVSVSTEAPGSLRIESNFDDYNPPIAVPRDAFVLRGTHQSGVHAPDAVGSFAPDQASAVQDVVFSDTGLIRGTVRRHTGVAVPADQVRALRSDGGPWVYADLLADGTFVLTGLLPGTYTVIANALGLEATTTASVAAGVATPTDVILPATGTVTGVVRNANNEPLPDRYVYIQEGSFYRDTSTSSVDPVGAFTLTDVPAGTHTLIVYDSSLGYTTFPVTVVADQTTTVDVRLPAVATVRIHVTRGDGTPFAGANVYVRHPGQANPSFHGSTNASGVLSVTVREGQFGVSVRDPSTSAFFGSTQGTVAQADHGGTVDVFVTPGLTGNVHGKVTASDGATPIANVFVVFADVLSGDETAWAYTDASGAYAIDNVSAGAQGFRLQADWNGAHTSVQAAFTEAGQTVTVDLVLPFSVVQGTVTYSDGASVPSASVFAVSLDADGNPLDYFWGSTAADGHYALLGIPVGNFRLTAQDSVSGLTTTVTSALSDVSEAVRLDVILPPSGTVNGQVRDENGNPKAGASVALIDLGLSYDRETVADESGHYQFDHVGLGAFVIQACEFDGDSGDLLRCASAEGNVTSETPPVSVDVSLPARRSVTGTVFEADGTTPVPGASVTVESLTSTSIWGSFARTLSTDENGAYALADVPEGTVRVSARPSDDGPSAGVAIRELSGSDVIVDVVFGTATRFPYALDGADGFRYDLECHGSIVDGGRTDGSLIPSYGIYGGGQQLYVADASLACRSESPLEDAAREVAFGPTTGRALRVERKVFVPAGGGFARYLEVITNTTSEPRATSVEVDSNYYRPDASTGPDVVVAPEATGNTYALVSQPASESGVRAVVGDVFAGPGAAVTPTVLYFVSGETWQYVGYEVTVPAHATVILMHFVIQGTPGDVPSAQARADALVALGGEALAGLSPSERAQIVNFNVPAP